MPARYDHHSGNVFCIFKREMVFINILAFGNYSSVTLGGFIYESSNAGLERNEKNNS